MGFFDSLQASIGSSLIDPIQELNNTLDVELLPNPDDYELAFAENNADWFKMDFKPLENMKFYADVRDKLPFNQLVSNLPTTLKGRVKFNIIYIYYYYLLDRLIVLYSYENELRKIIENIQLLDNTEVDLKKATEYWWAIDKKSKNLSIKWMDLFAIDSKLDEEQSILLNTSFDFMNDINANDINKYDLAKYLPGKTTLEDIYTINNMYK